MGALLQATFAEEPEENVAVVSLIHGDVTGIACQIPSWERRYQAQLSP